MRIYMHVCYRMHMHVYMCVGLANNVRPHYHNPIDQWVVCISACAVMHAHDTMSREVNIEDAHEHPAWLQQSLFCNLHICSCRCMLSWKALQNSSSGCALLEDMQWLTTLCVHRQCNVLHPPCLMYNSQWVAICGYGWVKKRCAELLFIPALGLAWRVTALSHRTGTFTVIGYQFYSGSDNLTLSSSVR